MLLRITYQRRKGFLRSLTGSESRRKTASLRKGKACYFQAKSRRVEDMKDQVKSRQVGDMTEGKVSSQSRGRNIKEGEGLLFSSLEQTFLNLLK